VCTHLQVKNNSGGVGDAYIFRFSFCCLVFGGMCVCFYVCMYVYACVCVYIYRCIYLLCLFLTLLFYVNV